MAALCGRLTARRQGLAGGRLWYAALPTGRVRHLLLLAGERCLGDRVGLWQDEVSSGLFGLKLLAADGRVGVCPRHLHCPVSAAAPVDGGDCDGVALRVGHEEVEVVVLEGLDVDDGLRVVVVAGRVREDAGVGPRGQGYRGVEDAVGPGGDLVGVGDRRGEKGPAIVVSEGLVGGDRVREGCDRPACCRSRSTLAGSAQNCADHSMPPKPKTRSQPVASLSQIPPPWWS